MTYRFSILAQGLPGTALGILLVVLFCSSVSAQPKLQYPREEIKLGTVFNGSAKTARVTLKNVGTTALRIISVRTSCGCTTVKQPKESLNPGESDVIDVSFDATGFRGRVTKYINIETNDPESGLVSIPMIADVSEELVPSSNSSFLWFGTIPVGKSSGRNFTYVNVTSKTIAISSASSSVPEVSARVSKKRIAPKDSITFAVTALPTLEGYISADIILHTDSENQPRVPLRITYIAARQQ